MGAWAKNIYLKLAPNALRIVAVPHGIQCDVSGRSELFVFEVKGAAVNYLNYGNK